MFGPKTPFYEYVLESLGRGFLALEHECAWIAGEPKHEAIGRWLKSNAISLVIEINRVLPATVDWPKDVAHACWLQDYRFANRDLTNDLGKSDHIYFLLPPRAFGIDMSGRSRWSILSPGARPETQLAPSGERFDFAFCGFLPAPIPDDRAVAIAADGRSIGIREFVSHFREGVLSHWRFVLSDVRREIAETCAKLNCKMIRHSAAWKAGGETLIDEDLIRTNDRRAVLSALLSVSPDLRIYGPEQWKQWPEFAPYHRGMIADPKSLGEIYRSARINVHTGQLAMHFRVIDCMAAGGFIMINRTIFDDEPGGIDRFLAAGEHYARYDIDNAAEVARRYLPDERARSQIALDGRAAILAAHTWTHRAEQILRDFS